MLDRKQNQKSTIFSLASGYGRCGVAVIRISGPSAQQAYKLLTKQEKLPAPRVASLQKFYHPANSSLIDLGLSLFFPAPHSYTGEDVLELQLHGGLNVVKSCLAALATCPDLRLAERGEFTKRGFLNGQFDLTAAEAVADLINAETETQRLQALRQMDGELAAVYDQWRTQLVAALAYQEALIDFVDEDLGTEVPLQVMNLVKKVTQEVTAHLQDHRGEKVRAGLQVVILGEPNVGKSSLLNSLAKRDCAIVTSQAGTTRDMIEVHVDLDGLPVTLVDTAGLREAQDLVEKEGIRRSHLKATSADLKLLLCEASALKKGEIQFPLALDQTTILVANKADLCPDFSPEQHFATPVVAVSAKHGTGVSRLLVMIKSVLEKQLTKTDSPVMTNARHREALTTVALFLNNVIQRPTAASELTAEELRLAVKALGEITGRVNVEQVLDKIFSSFCIGK